MSHQNSWFHTLPSICLSWVQTCDIIKGRHLPHTVTHKHLTGSEKGEGVLRSPFPSSLKMRITSEWNFMSLIPLRGSTVLLIKQSSHFTRLSPLMKICEQRKAGRRKQALFFFLLPIVPCALSPVTRVSLSFRARLCAKNQAPEEEAKEMLLE